MARKGKKFVSEAPVLIYEDAQSPTFHWLLNKQTVSLDLGNGKVSGWRLVDGRLQHVMLPNARVRVTGFKLAQDVTTMGVQEVLYADFMGERYGFGDGVWAQSDYPVETFANSVERYGSAYHVFMGVLTLAMMDVPTVDPLTLIVSAPPGLVNEVAKKIKRAFIMGESGAKDGCWSIKLGHEKEARTYVIEKVIVIPEGAGAFAAYAYDVNGNNANVTHSETGHDLLAGRVLIADGGMGTFDSYMVTNGLLAAEAIRQSTDGNYGIQALIIRPVIDAIVNLFTEKGWQMPRVYEPQVDAWLRSWVVRRTTEDATVVLEGHQLNLHNIFVAACHRAGELVVSQQLAPQFQRNQVDTVLAVGGLWVYIGSDVRDAFPNRNILLPFMVSHIRDIPLFDLNGYGGLALAANNQRLFRKVNS